MISEKIYELIPDLECTCSACPTQYEGTLKTGENIYFRYRWGGGSVEINGQCYYSFDTNDALNGVMESEEVFAHLIKGIIAYKIDKKRKENIDFLWDKLIDLYS